MGRPKKGRKANELGIVPLHYTKRDFEEHKKSVIDFAEALRYRNRDLIGRELSRDEVTQQYTIAVLEEYSTTGTKSFELLSQLETPAYNEYWAKLVKDESSQEKHQQIEGTSFKLSTRKLPLALTQQYPHCVLLERKKLGLVIVPSISLRTVQNIQFKEIVTLVLDANTEFDLLHLYMRELWVAIIRRVYHFVDAAEQKNKLEEMDASDEEVTSLLESYRLSHERSISNSALGTSPSFKAEAKFRSTGKFNTEKGKKRSVEEEQEQEQKGGKEGDEGRGHATNEENKDEAYVEDEGPSTKRQKRNGTEEGRWQGFEEELDLAGATPSVTPVFYRFADTGIPLRFKG